MRLILRIAATGVQSTVFQVFCLWLNMKPIPLSQLDSSAVARVEELDVYSEDATRLKAMGICVGRQVQLMRSGDPMILRVLGARVGLSARLAAGVGVVPVA